MLIRPYVRRDLTPLIALTIDTFRPYFEESFRPLMGETIFAVEHANWREDYHTQVAGFHDPDQHKYVAVAENDGAIAGYVAWCVEPARQKGSITLLAVAAGYRRHQAGTALCEHAFDEMRGLGATVVEIGTGGDAFHAPARALYERLGCTQMPVAAYYRQL